MKKQNVKIGSTNIRRLPENVLLICMNYGFTGVNFIISGIFEINSNDSDYEMSIMIGIIMLCMVPISYFDRRKEMCGKFSVTVSCIMHFALSIWTAYICLLGWIMILYAVEVLISMGIIFIKSRRYQKNNRKKDR